jgi:multidrug/hemolysin transport system permease protein
MKVITSLIRRNIKLFFNDKGLFFTSLITPVILLVLYASFLSNVYRDSLMSGFVEGMTISDRLADSIVSGQLISSILAVSCVTVAFCSNMLMVQDKVTGARKDFEITPVKTTTLSLSYYFATLISTLIICFCATGVCLVYAKIMNSYIGIKDILYLILDVFLLSMMGTALSSIVNYFLSSQGQISAVGTIVSSGYGFVCGAYMPISQFSPTLQKIISVLPGTYATSLIRNHALGSSFEQMKKEGIPTEMIEEIKDAFDLNIYFFGTRVDISSMYFVLTSSVVVLIGIYVLVNYGFIKRKGRR